MSRAGGDDESDDDDGHDLGRRRGRSSDAFEEPKCHFCNGKMTGDSDILYCTSLGCGRVLCTNCVHEHFAHVYLRGHGADGAPATAPAADPIDYNAEDERAGEWLCVVCRHACCCAGREASCTRTHTHCRMYAKKQKRKRLATELGAPDDLGLSLIHI